MLRSRAVTQEYSNPDHRALQIGSVLDFVPSGSAMDSCDHAIAPPMFNTYYEFPECPPWSVSGNVLDESYDTFLWRTDRCRIPPLCQEPNRTVFNRRVLENSLTLPVDIDA